MINAIRQAWGTTRRRGLPRLLPPGSRRGEAARAARRALALARGHAWSAAARELGRVFTAALGASPLAEYEAWQDRHALQPAEAARQRAWRPRAPLSLSVLTPLFRTPPEWLAELAESLFAQTYENWQWIVVLADGESPELRDMAARLASNDRRMRLVYVARNDGIAAATNVALAHAEGEYVIPVDHDDRLSPDALYHLANAADEESVDGAGNTHPPCDLIYADEDYLSADGRRRFKPRLKPGWSPESILASNYVCHPVAIRLKTCLALGGWRSACDGAQDWDLLLRMSDRELLVRHVPRVLYHWRAARGSTALAASEKPHVSQAQRRALVDCFQRRGCSATPEPMGDGRWCIRWPTRLKTPVSVVIPTRDHPELLGQALESVWRASPEIDLDIVLVDHESRDPRMAEFYRRWQGQRSVRVVEFHGKFNYSAACNLGARHARGDLLLFLNNDVQTDDPRWIAQLAGWASQAAVGVVGPLLLYPHGTVQHAGVVIGGPGLASHALRHLPPDLMTPAGSPTTLRNVLAVTGACQMMRREVFEAVGRFDESYELCYSDLALCLKAWKKGFRNLLEPAACLLHHECATRIPGDARERADAQRFQAELAALGFTEDPYWSPMLSAGEGLPGLVDHPRIQARALFEPSQVAAIRRIHPAEPLDSRAASRHAATNSPPCEVSRW